MTKDDIKTIILDIMTEYLPGSVNKTTKNRVIDEIVSELSEQGVLTIEDEESEPAADEDKAEDLYRIFGE